MEQNGIELLSELLAAHDEGTAVVLATVVKSRGSVPRRAGAKMLIYEDGRFSGTIGGGEMESRVLHAAAMAFQDGKPRTVPFSLVDPERGDPGLCGGEVEIYVEPFLSPATILVIGCGHVGRAVAQLADWLGFRVVVNDDRAEMVTPELVPGADIYVAGTITNILSEIAINERTYVVVVTRNVEVDVKILPELLRTPAAYIGVIGSRRRWEETQRLLKEGGIGIDQIGRIHSPIGLELKAETPEEIALSIMAEIVMLYRRGTKPISDLDKSEPEDV